MLSSLQIATLLSIKSITRKIVINVGTKFESSIPDNKEIIEKINENTNDESKKINYEQFNSNFNRIEDIFEKASKENIKSINLWETNFPKLLSHIPDPPAILYYKGNLNSIIDFPTVAIIGTRNPTPYGYKIAERISERISGAGITIVSGLATGCDQGAHIGCLSINGKTAALLAHGLQMIYPKSNTKLAQDIVENNGCLLSEYIYNSEIDRFNFVERDRLQSGLSFATIVVETDIKGGTMHTVKFTLKQNRMLYCFNHPLEKRSNTSQGNQFLIKNGDAQAINTLEDVNNLILKIKNKFCPNLVSSIDLEIIPNLPNPVIDSIQNNVETTDKLIYSYDQLAKRLKLKSEVPIKTHINKGDFTQWVRKKDFENLDWQFDPEKNQFTAFIEKTLFD